MPGRGSIASVSCNSRSSRSIQKLDWCAHYGGVAYTKTFTNEQAFQRFYKSFYQSSEEIKFVVQIDSCSSQTSARLAFWLLDYPNEHPTIVAKTSTMARGTLGKYYQQLRIGYRYHLVLAAPNLLCRLVHAFIHSVNMTLASIPNLLGYCWLEKSSTMFILDLSVWQLIYLIGRMVMLVPSLICWKPCQSRQVVLWRDSC